MKKIKHRSEKNNAVCQPVAGLFLYIGALVFGHLSYRLIGHNIIFI